MAETDAVGERWLSRLRTYPGHSSSQATRRGGWWRLGRTRRQGLWTGEIAKPHMCCLRQEMGIKDFSPFVLRGIG